MTSAASVRPHDGLLWYAGYGSNLAADRFGCYVAGGRAQGALRTQPGCRDPRPARDRRAVHLPGTVYYALESTTWTGGMALYDPSAAGRAAACAYLVTVEQFCDVASQEMHREPGRDLDLSAFLAGAYGTRLVLGPGRYETLVHCGWVEGRPLVTVTAPWTVDEAPLNAPSAAYVRVLAAGLSDAHGWPPGEVTDYLHGRPGAASVWDRQALLDVVTAACGSPA